MQVDQSDLPFRLLCRKYGANLCFTPMIHAKMFVEKPAYKKKFWSYINGTPESDRPLIVQLCGSEKHSLLQTVNEITQSKGGGIDGIDLNCGCPQTIAKRGMYGAFLLEKPELILEVVKFLVANVDCPVSVKVRILPSGVEDSLKLYEKLIDAGASMLTIHGRNRLQKGLKIGHADWSTIKQAVDLLGHRVPILANGSTANLDEVRECLEATGADGVMSAEAILEYPAIFNETGTKAVKGCRVGPGRLSLTREYIALCQEYPPEKGGQGNGIKCVRGHFHRFLHEDLQSRPEIRDSIAYTRDYDVLRKACDDIEALQKSSKHRVENEALSWYMRHRKTGCNGDNMSDILDKRSKEVTHTDLDDEAAGCFTHLFGEDG